MNSLIKAIQLDNSNLLDKIENVNNVVNPRKYSFTLNTKYTVLPPDSSLLVSMKMINLSGNFVQPMEPILKFHFYDSDGNELLNTNDRNEFRASSIHTFIDPSGIVNNGDYYEYVFTANNINFEKPINAKLFSIHFYIEMNVFGRTNINNSKTYLINQTITLLPYD